MSFSRKRALLLLPALALGVAVFVFFMKTRTPPQRDTLAERVAVVRAILAPEVALTPRAVGYGIVQPGKTWAAVAQVGGEIVDIHPELKEGAIISQGELLFRIDPAEYGLATTRSEADLANIRAQIHELEQRERNLANTLITERQALNIALQELGRKQQLLRHGTVAASEVDQQERQYLTQKTVVQDLENTLALIPAEREALEAQLESGRAHLEDSRLDVGRTEIRAPFPLRVEEVNVELHEYAPTGSVLAEAHDIAEAEIPAQVPLLAMRGLINSEGRLFIPGEPFDMQVFRESLGLSAIVRLVFGEASLEWDARFERMGEEIDARTRTVAVYVVVDNPYDKAVPGKRPPLMKNMYCQVELRGRPLPPMVIIPRSALRQGDVVYVCGQEGRLEMRQTTPGFSQGDFVAIESGLAPGDCVVVSDLQPAVAGQLLETEQDNELRELIIAQATAEAPLQ